MGIPWRVAPLAATPPTPCSPTHTHTHNPWSLRGLGCVGGPLRPKSPPSLDCLNLSLAGVMPYRAATPGCGGARPPPRNRMLYGVRKQARKGQGVLGRQWGRGTARNGARERRSGGSALASAEGATKEGAAPSQGLEHVSTTTLSLRKHTKTHQWISIAVKQESMCFCFHRLALPWSMTSST